jgi:hypothetical protein
MADEVLYVFASQSERVLRSHSGSEGAVRRFRFLNQKNWIGSSLKDERALLVTLAKGLDRAKLWAFESLVPFSEALLKGYFVAALHALWTDPDKATRSVCLC